MKTVLHVGCCPYNPAKLHKTFHGPGWRELRLDIDPRVAPDIVASMTVLPLAGQAVDAVSSSHGLEHLCAQEVAVALGEFHRVLKPDGFTAKTLGNALVHAGFAQARVSRSGFDLWALATKQSQASG